MSITYGDMPSSETCMKLSMISFDSPSKNFRVYKFCTALQICQRFFENERKKLLDKYGKEISPGTYQVETEPYNREIKKLLSLKIEDDIPDHGLTEQDFLDTKCEYPKEKSMWMSAADIQAIIFFSNKIKAGD